ncbi:MAG: galactonate dehydratase [Candidatus Abyssobacteria bacterium SURF_17]|uniref:Galactonate dehydratase n=1 Tax=Candidatus Abyssobacteria bacterium SURF_17 TaxID=2093361 RepID=A0A419ETF0_9BACT|nr:MAG: galactonate dehydratase [Candidatus Abyssubacteria bacterium SURF_17]
MRITKIEIFTAPPPRSWMSPVMTRIHTDEGISGIGEVALAYGLGGEAGARMIKEMAQFLLLGQDPFRIEYIWDRMFRDTFWGQGGGPVVYGAMSAIDEALYDIKGKALKVPAYELLGGKCRDKLRLYANGWYIGASEPEEYGEAAKKVVADGYTAMKFDPFAIRPDGSWGYPDRVIEKDMARCVYKRVKAVREAVGPDVDILIECHGNLGTTSAIQIGKRLEELAPFFYEEPVDALNVDSMKKVSEHVNVPIAAGERLYSRYHFRKYVEDQVLDILQPDIGLAGGLTETKKIATYAETYNLVVAPHNCAGPVATAAAVQLDAAMTNFIIQEWFPYFNDEHYALVTNAFEKKAVNGFFEIPDTPGLGIELSEETIKNHERIVVG